jgi:hypothetical protein
VPPRQLWFVFVRLRKRRTFLRALWALRTRVCLFLCNAGHVGSSCLCVLRRRCAFLCAMWALRARVYVFVCYVGHNIEMPCVLLDVSVCCYA